MDSILDSVKKMLGIDPEYTDFDEEVIMHTNSVLMTLSQLGVGPSTGFSIEDKTQTWADLLGTATNLAAVKSFLYAGVRLVFDPPTSSTVLDALERQMKEFGWRLQVEADPPIPIPVPEEE